MIKYCQQNVTVWLPAGIIGTHTWISGETLDPTYKKLSPLDQLLPAWLPRKLYVARCSISHQTLAAQENGGELVVLVDRARRMFATGNPPYYQDGDHSAMIGLCSIVAAPNEPQKRTAYWRPPVYVDMDVDSLWAIQGMATVDQFTFSLSILVPSPDNIEPEVLSF